MVFKIAPSMHANWLCTFRYHMYQLKINLFLCRTF
jgi:hypothetical protein